MSRREHQVDELVRRLPFVGDTHIGSDRDAKEALFEKIVRMPLPITTDPASDTAPHSGRPTRIPRPAFVLVATLMILSIAAIGSAVVNSLGSTTAVGCHTSETEVAVIDSVSGDPIVDCAAEWEQLTGEPAPDLRAYANASGGIAVVPADTAVPEDWEPLELGIVQDARVIDLRVSLDDLIAGLPSTCHLLEDGRDVAEREIERLGLAGWSVVSERGEADGAATCTYFYLDADEQRVVLVPLEGVVPDETAPYMILARDLDAALDEACLAVEEAADVARSLAGAVDLIEGQGLVVHEHVDDQAPCTRGDVNAFGRVEVTVRGPAATD